MVQTAEEPAYAADRCPSPSDKANSAPVLGEAIDTKFLRSWRVALGENSSEFLAEVIGVYFEEAARVVRSLVAAASIGDALLLKYQAHSLKSSSATLGAMTLSQLCYALESMTGTGTTAGAQNIVLQICSEYERVKAALQTELQQCREEHGQS